MTNLDFSTPQRQSAIGIIVLIANSTQKVIRATAIPIFIFIYKAKINELVYVLLGALVLLIISVIIAYLSYLKFTFFLDETKQEFIVNEGILNRTLLTIPLEKIQQININQSFLQKLVGVYSLQIDTAGNDGKEVSIKAIEHQIALALKERLLNGKITVDTINNESAEIEKPNIPFVKISTNTLAKVGLTSNYGSSLALLAGFTYAVFHNIKDLLKAFDTDNGQVETLIEKGFNLASLGVLVAVLITLLLLINLVRTFVKYYNLQLSKHKNSLLISSGLLATKNTLLSPKKVQLTTYSQNYFQRKMNMLNLELKQTEVENKQDGEEVRSSNLSLPGCSKAEKDAILEMILGKFQAENLLLKPNFRFLNLPTFFKAVLPVAIFFVLLNFTEELKPYYPLTIAYFFLTTLMIFISFKNHRLMVNQDIIIKKSGIWDITHEHLLPHKIQSISAFQYPWHKSVDVGHVDLHTAAGVIHFKFGNYTEIKKLVNYWLYQVESSGKDWM